jgi:hypothetical protein
MWIEERVSDSGTASILGNLGQSTFSPPPFEIYVGFCFLVSLLWLYRLHL